MNSPQLQPDALFPVIEGFPPPIARLTEETTELPYLLGEDHRIIGVFGLQAEIARELIARRILNDFYSVPHRGCRG